MPVCEDILIFFWILSKSKQYINNPTVFKSLLPKVSCDWLQLFSDPDR